jgi:steroid delta-isomerase-like uncharacterized protein
VEFDVVKESLAQVFAWCEKDFAQDYVNHLPSKDVNREDTIRGWESWLSGFSDMKMVIHDMVAESDRVVVRLTFYGKHTGEFMGIPAIGKSVEMNDIAIYRIAGGRIAEVWDYGDELGLMTQLGTISSTIPGKQ